MVFCGPQIAAAYVGYVTYLVNRIWDSYQEEWKLNSEYEF